MTKTCVIGYASSKSCIVTPLLFHKIPINESEDDPVNAEQDKGMVLDKFKKKFNGRDSDHEGNCETYSQDSKLVERESMPGLH